jgi:hypothetical protein
MSTSTNIETIASTHVTRQTALDEDGWEYDVDTGEVLRFVGLPSAPLAESFKVTDDASAEWVLELRSKLEGEIVGIDARLEALQKCLLSMRRDRVNRLKTWDWRFAPSLIEYAKSKLVGKSKKAKFAHGIVAFHASTGTNKITDMEAAVAFVEEFDPGLVKVVKTTNVTNVKKIMDEYEVSDKEIKEVAVWLESTGPRESVTISTGIEVKQIKED